MPVEQTNIDKRMIERGIWIATHRLAIQRGTTIGLYVAVAIIYAIFFVNFGLYMYRFNEWNQLAAYSASSLYDWAPIHAAREPVPLELGNPVFFPLGDDRYDFVVEVYNPNNSWAAETVEYRFTLGGATALPLQSAVVLPRERRYLSLLNQPVATAVSAVSFSSDEIEWRRVKDLPPLGWIFNDVPAYRGKRVLIEQGVQTVIPAGVSWSVTNGSTWNVREVTWQIGLYSGDVLAGVLQYQSGAFPYLDEQRFDLTIHRPMPRVDKVFVYPLVNVLDPDFAYLASTP